MKSYPLAPNGIFLTVQGEGALIGVPMIFVRLAGCSVGCPECDTDYSVFDKRTAKEIAWQCEVVKGTTCAEWVWLTGGEPTDHELTDLIEALHKAGFKAALATAGQNYVPGKQCKVHVDWLSVSPHNLDKWTLYTGDELKFVAGLNGLKLSDALDATYKKPIYFGHKYVAPCDGKPETLQECLAFVNNNRGWKLACQAHKQWGVA